MDVDAAPEHDEHRRHHEDEEGVPREGAARLCGAVCEWKAEGDGVVRGQRNRHPAERLNDSRHDSGPGADRWTISWSRTRPTKYTAIPSRRCTSVALNAVHAAGCAAN